MSKLEEGIQKLMGYVEEMRKEGINVCRPQFKQFDLLEMMLISKQYPLVKRLVDNDKIDTDNKFTIMVNVENKRVGYSHTFEGYESILMLLSIQDEPIEFLLSIIK